MTSDPATYQFSPRPRSGIVFGLSGRHILVAGIAGAAVLGLLMGGQLLPGLMIAIVTAILVLVPVGQERVIDWLWVRIGFVYRLTTGKGRRDDPTPVVGWADVVVGGRTWGVRKTSEMVGEVWMHVISAPEFTLRSAEHQDQLLADWGNWLAALAREGSPVREVTWLEVASPSASGGPEAWMAEHANPRSGAMMADYARLLDGLTSSSTEHEVYLRVRFQPRTSRTDLTTATATSAEQLRATVRPFSVVPLPSSEVARLVEAIAVPGASLAAGARRARGMEPADPQPVPPLLEAGDQLRIGSQRAQVWWASELPRIPVRADSFSTIFATSVPCTRLLWTTIAPISPWRAERRAEAARTHLESERDSKRRQGYVPKLSAERELIAVETRTHELLSGHSMLQHSTFAAIVAPTAMVLDDAAATLESAAGTCGIVLRRLGPRQRAALGTLIPEVLP